MKLTEILRIICRVVTFPFIVAGVVLYMLLFRDSIDDDLGGDN